MPISQDTAFAYLERHFDTSWHAVTTAGQRYAAQPDLTAWDARTMANTLNCLVHHELISHFDGVPGVRAHEDRRNQMRFVAIDDAILLWPKKVDSQRVKSNLMLTEHSMELVSTQTAFDFLPRAALVVLGYWFDDDGTLKRVSFAPPSVAKPAWYIDVHPGDTNVVEMRRPSQSPSGLTTPSGLRITKGPIQEQM